MDIDALRSFVAITETGRFTLAGRRVGRTQSAISQQVRKLEVELGRPLFERSATAVSLTEHGARLLPHARQIIAAHEAALASFERGRISGVVSIGMPESYAASLLPRTLPGFQAQYPGAAISLVLRESPALSRMLADGALDLAFLTEGEVGAGGGPRLLTEPMVWVASRTQQTESRDPLPLVVWREGSNYRNIVLRAFEAAGRPCRIAVSTQGLGGMIAAVVAGLGIAAVAQSQATAPLRVLGSDAGLPPLPELVVRLERGSGARTPLADRLERHLIEVLAPP